MASSTNTARVPMSTKNISRSGSGRLVAGVDKKYPLEEGQVYALAVSGTNGHNAQ